MNDSGLWKRGILLFALVAVIAGVALWVALRRPGVPTTNEEPLCPELLSQLVYSPAASATAPFPANINWSVLHQLAQTAPSAKGWEIRYNAALTLARKGVAGLPFDTLCEMLNEQQQALNFSVCQKNCRMAVDEAAARRTVYNALQAVATWSRHPDKPKKFVGENADLRKKHDAGLEKLTRAVEQLTQSPNQVLRTEAIKTLQTLRDAP